MLINCVAYQEGKKLKDIAIEEISDYLLIPDCFVWVALQDATLLELEKMREEFDLHPLAVEDSWAQPSTAKSRRIRRFHLWCHALGEDGKR